VTTRPAAAHGQVAFPARTGLLARHPTAADISAHLADQARA
jgi:hypothetical protein